MIRRSVNVNKELTVMKNTLDFMLKSTAALLATGILFVFFIKRPLLARGVENLNPTTVKLIAVSSVLVWVPELVRSWFRQPVGFGPKDLGAATVGPPASVHLF